MGRWIGSWTLELRPDVGNPWPCRRRAWRATAALILADLNGDLVWTHAIDTTTGKVSELGRLKSKRAGMHPRYFDSPPERRAFVRSNGGRELALPIWPEW